MSDAALVRSAYLRAVTSALADHVIADQVRLTSERVEGGSLRISFHVDADAFNERLREHSRPIVEPDAIS